MAKRASRTERKSRNPVSTPTSRLPLFGPPPLIEGEDAAVYDELLRSISAQVKPTDIIEEIWVQDVADLVWESFRLRRLKANLMVATAHKGLRIVLYPLMDEAPGKLVEDWIRRKKRAIDRVDNMLASAGLTVDGVMAMTLSENLESVERIERMIAIAQTRREDILDEIDRRRARFGRTLRHTLAQIDNGANRELEPGLVNGALSDQHA